VWIAADHVGLSPIITLVSFAMTVGQLAPGPDRRAAPDFLLRGLGSRGIHPETSLAFVLIGLQLRMMHGDWRTYALCAGGRLPDGGRRPCRLGHVFTATAGSCGHGTSRAM